MSNSLSVVVAVQGSAGGLPSLLDSLGRQRTEDVDVVLAWASDDEAAAAAVSGAPGWARRVPGPEGALIPELWTVGIESAEADRVALTIVHCQPGPDWLDVLRAADLSSDAGVGGPIRQTPDADPVSWAIYLQRYVPFGPGVLPEGKVVEIAGDNALYARDCLEEVRDSWQDGFWELDVHAAFRARGWTLRFDPALEVEHRNRYSPAEFVRQRFRHGLLFGRGRVEAMPAARRALYRALSPAIPVLFGRKVVQRALAWAPARPHLIAAAPWLLVFLAAWSAGEILGANKRSAS